MPDAPSHRFDGDTQVNGTLNANRLQVAGESAFAQAAMRDQAMNTVLGYYHETSPKHHMSNSTAMLTGNTYCTAVGLLAGDLVTTMGIHVATAGSVLTLVKFGLLSKAGALLAVSADVKADMAAAGGKTIPMVTPYRVPTTDLYYIAGLAVGTTGPSVSRGLSLATDTKTISATYGSCGIVTSQTDIQLANTISFTTGVLLPLWTCIA